MSIFDWKDGEYQYCADIVRVGGTREVPKNAIRSYINVQIASAERDNRRDVVAALWLLQEKAPL